MIVNVWEDDFIKIRKLSFLYYNLVWNKQFSKTTTLLYFALERWSSHEVILESWCSKTRWRAYTKRSPLRIWSNFLTRMLRWEPRSLSLVNLDEAAQAEFRWWAPVRHTSDGCYGYKHRGSRRQTFTIRGILESLSIGTAATMSILHDHLRVDPPQANNGGVGLSGASWCCESLTEAVHNWSGKCWQVKKRGSINMIRKQRCSERFGCFRMSPHPKI